jgi:hypothetical protein
VNESVKVKIAVAVDGHGHWYAWGSDGSLDDDMLGEANVGVHDDCERASFFVEAELPVPKPIAVAGVSRPADGGTPQ